MKKLLLISPILMLCTACNQVGWNIKPSGEIVTDTLNVKSFTTLLNNSSANVEMDANVKENQIVVIGDKNFVENLDIENKEDDLNIKNKKKASFNTSSSPLIVKINNPNLQKVMIAGSGSIATNNVVLTTNIEFHISGAGEVNVDLFNNTTSIFLSGVGSINLRGTTSELKAIMSGAGSLNAEKLRNQTSLVEISGAGNAKVNTTDEINVKISGIGNLDYKKYDQLKVVEKVSGIGNVGAY